MKLVIDLQGAQSASRWRGIGRYSLSLAQSMCRHRGDHDIHIALSDAFPDTVKPIRNAFDGLIPAENIHVWSAPTPVQAQDPANQDRRRRAEVIYESFLASLNPDMIHISSVFEGFGDDVALTIKQTNQTIPVAVTLYDLIPLHDPERFLAPNLAWFKLYQERLDALKRADLFLAISEFSAEDTVRYLEVDPDQVTNISAACGDIFRPSDMAKGARTDLRARLGLAGPYFLTSGTIEPHKNLSTLFRAFTLLPPAVQDSHKIAIMGHASDSQKVEFAKMAEAAGLDPAKMVITGYIDDDALVALYSDADLMVFPSSDEGFGLPPLEAMSCGTPTLGSRAASIPEVIGMDGAMFDPFNPGALAQLMQRALQDADFRATLIENAQTQSQKFSWDRSGKRALAAMEARLASQPTPTSLPDTPLQMCLNALAHLPHPQGADLGHLAEALAYTFAPTEAPRQLLVDISELHLTDARTGCQRVVRAILQEWLRMPPEGFVVEPVYAMPDRLGYWYARTFTETFTGRPAAGPDAPIEYTSGDIFIGLDLQPVIVQVQRPVLEQMRARGVEVRFVIYDLLPIQKPDYFPRELCDAFHRWLETIALFDGVIGISQASVDAFRIWRMAHNIGDDQDFRYDVAHLGADIESSHPTTGLPDDHAEVLATMADRPTFLMVGTIEPRKGHKQVLSAFSRLWAEGVDANLVIVGKEGWDIARFAERIRTHPEQGARLFWLEGISDEYLGQVYNAATCLIAASTGEGFGLPLIEAAQAGMPILARDIPVFREVAGDHATYFHAPNAADLAQSIQGWLAADAKDTAPGSQDLPWITWQESAARMAHALLAPTSPEQGPVIEQVQGFQPQPLRIVVTKLDHMGDLLLAMPAISRLRARYPAAQIDAVVGSWNSDMARQLGLFGSIYTFDFFSKKSAKTPEAQAEILAMLTAEVGFCDIAIDLRRQPDTRFILTALQADLKVGYETGIEPVDRDLDIALPHWGDIPFEATPLNRTHITKQMLALIDALPDSPDDYVHLPALLGMAQDGPKTRSVALFPKAGNAVKEWGDTKFLALAEALAARPDIDRVTGYFGTTEEANAAGFQETDIIKIAAGLDFNALCTTLATHQVCVANNSFGAHIASYLGVHVVGIYAAHELAEEWGPIFGLNDVIRQPVWCAPTHLPDPAHGTQDMLGLNIPVDQVHRRVMSILGLQA